MENAAQEKKKAGGRYRVTGTIGRGGFGVIYKGEDILGFMEESSFYRELLSHPFSSVNDDAS